LIHPKILVQFKFDGMQVHDDHQGFWNVKFWNHQVSPDFRTHIRRLVEMILILRCFHGYANYH